MPLCSSHPAHLICLLHVPKRTLTEKKADGKEEVHQPPQQKKPAKRKAKKRTAKGTKHARTSENHRHAGVESNDKGAPKVVKTSLSVVDHELEKASFSAAKGARKVIDHANTAVEELEVGSDILWLFDDGPTGWVQGTVIKVRGTGNDTECDVKFLETAINTFPKVFKLSFPKTSYGRLPKIMSWMLLKKR
jgi:hypothetical protein